MAKKINIEKKIGIFDGLKLIFKNLNYIFLTFLFSLLFWLLIRLLSQYSWLRFVANTSLMNTTAKFSAYFSAPFGNLLNFTIFQHIIYAFMAILVGINISILIFTLKNHVRNCRTVKLGVSAMILGILGIGCLSCGSFLLVTALGATSTLSIIYFLPLKGLEINIFAILVLLLSIYLTIKQINNKYDTNQKNNCKTI